MSLLDYIDSTTIAMCMGVFKCTGKAGELCYLVSEEQIYVCAGEESKGIILLRYGSERLNFITVPRSALSKFVRLPSFEDLAYENMSISTGYYTSTGARYKFNPYQGLIAAYMFKHKGVVWNGYSWVKP